MNEIQENIPEDQETVSFDLDDDNQTSVVAVETSEKEETRTIVRDSDDGANDDDLENYSENVQKRINQLTAKRKQAIEEAEAAYQYAQQVQHTKRRDEEEALRFGQGLHQRVRIAY